MDAEMLGEAKDFVSGWIDKAGADGDGIDYQVSLRWQLSFFSMLARVSKTLWTVNSAPSGTALSERASRSR